MSPVVVKEKGKAEKRKKDEKEKTNSETETVTPPAKQVSNILLCLFNCPYPTNVKNG